MLVHVEVRYTWARFKHMYVFSVLSFFWGGNRRGICKPSFHSNSMQGNKLSARLLSCVVFGSTLWLCSFVNFGGIDCPERRLRPEKDDVLLPSRQLDHRFCRAKTKRAPQSRAVVKVPGVVAGLRGHDPRLGVGSVPSGFPFWMKKLQRQSPTGKPRGFFKFPCPFQP